MLNIYDGAILQNSKLLQYQEQLSYLNENLESLVEDRTLDLSAEIETRKQAEELLLHEQLFSNSLLDNLPGIFFLYSYPDLKLIRWNKNHETILGYESGELKDWSVNDWIEPVTRQLILEGTKKIINDGHYMFEASLLTKDRHSIPFILTGVKFNLQDQKYIMGFGIDATELKRAEAEIKLINVELLKVNVEKDKFFSIIAHDLRSPICSFLGLTRLIVENLPSMELADIQDMAVSMEKSASNLYRMLENLLEWARMQRGLTSFNPEVIQLHSIVDECMEMMMEPLKDKGVEIKYDIPVDIRVIADANMLQTIIRNFVSNAMKFTPKGGKISLSANACANESIEITIKDTGIGMSPAMLGNLISAKYSNQ